MIYSNEQNFEIAQAIIRLRRTGHPSLVQRIELAVANELPFTKVEALYRPKNVKPEKPVPVEATFDHPPFMGKGSGQTPWRSFAKEVSDMDPDIIDSMSKSDIITVLKDKGVIAKVS